MSYGIKPPGYRLPEGTRIGGVHLRVSDIERSRAFYQEVLGFDVIEAEAGRVKLGVGSKELIELQSGAADPLRGARLGLYHFAILLPDRASLGQCLEHLSRPGIKLGAADHLVSEALYLSDPDGLGIEIYRDRPRSEWTVRGGELAMATEPLDFDAVIGAGGGMGWQGMPGGTTIGHVHLHVSDLERARAFYHEALGFDITVWSYPQALFFSAGGYHHHLGTNTWAPDARLAGAAEPMLVHWDLLLPSPQAVVTAADSLVQAGYSISPEEIGGSIVTDTDGIALRLAPSG
ncbi:MAG: VOC family protein [Gemmatimonadota bacterium]